MNADDVDPRLERKLKLLVKSSLRDPLAAAKGRTRFLAQAQELKAQIQTAKAVPIGLPARRNEWMNFLWRKEPRKMSILATIVLIVSLLVGGTGVTVAAAQASTPSDPLYSIKLAGEDTRFALARSEETRLQLALAFAAERADEVSAIFRAGMPVPEAVMTRWEQHLQTSLRLAAGMDEEKMKQALLQIHEQLRNQSRLMNQAENQAEDPLLLRARAMLQNQTGLVEDGLTEPETFRARIRAGQASEPPSPGNPWTTGTPTPGSGYGPGECSDCTPPGPGNPWTTGTPVPGSGYGPGPGPQMTSTNLPEGQNHGYPSNGQPANGQNNNGSDNGGGGGGGGNP